MKITQMQNYGYLHPMEQYQEAIFRTADIHIRSHAWKCHVIWWKYLKMKHQLPLAYIPWSLQTMSNNVWYLFVAPTIYARHEMFDAVLKPEVTQDYVVIFRSFWITVFCLQRWHGICQSRSVSGITTDSPCGVWGPKWITCLLHGGPLLGLWF